MTYRDEFREAGPFTATLTFYLSGDEPLDANGALERLALKFPFDNDGETESLRQMAAHMPGCSWVRQLKIQDYPIHFLLYAMEGDFVQPFTPWMNENRAKLWPEGAIDNLQDCHQWFVLETLLAPDNPQAAYGFMHRIAALVAGDRLIASYDVQAKKLRSRDEVYDLTAGEAPPPLAELYSLNYFPALFAGDGEVPPANAITTSGLARAMLPELTLLNIGSEAEVAGELCHSLASFFVLHGLPELETPVHLHRTAPALEFHTLSRFEMNPEFLDALVGGQEVPEETMQQLPLTYGGLPLPLHWVALPQRESSSSGDGEKGIITTSEAVAATQRLIAEANASGLMQLTPLESHLLAARARDRWAMLQTIWELADESTESAAQFGERPFFSYKVGYEIEKPAGSPNVGNVASNHHEDADADGFDLKQLAASKSANDAKGSSDETNPEAQKSGASESEPGESRGPREYLWFELVDVAGQGVQGRLLNEPIALTDLQRDDLAWHKMTEVADWVVGLSPDFPDPMLRGNRFGPGDMLALRHLKRLVESPRS